MCLIPAVQSPGRLGKRADLAGVFWRLLDHLAHRPHCSRHEGPGQCSDCGCFARLGTGTRSGTGPCGLLPSKCMGWGMDQAEASRRGCPVHRISTRRFNRYGVGQHKASSRPECPHFHYSAMVITAFLRRAHGLGDLEEV